MFCPNIADNLKTTNTVKPCYSEVPRDIKKVRKWWDFEITRLFKVIQGDSAQVRTDWVQL